MRKMFLLIAIITMPFMSFSQTEEKSGVLEAVSVIEYESNLISIDMSLDFVFENKTIGYRKVEPISKDPLIQNKMINAKKSNDLISIKAYMKSLQMKRKETLMS